MIRNRDFIVFSDDWGGHPFSCRHLMRQFIPRNRALWVHTVGMRRPRLTLYDLKRSVQKLRSFTGRSDAVELPAGLTTLSPAMLPFGSPLVRRFNRDSVVRTVRRKMKELGFRDPILLTTLPNAADYLGAFGEKATVYYCVDDFTLWPGVNRPLVAEMEERLLSRADLLVCSSPELARLKQRNGLMTEIIPHGVDFEHFARTGSRGCEPIPPLAGLGKPAIGYFGLLGEWVDLPLLELIAKRHPEWTLVLIGTVLADITRLATYPNVLFTGPIPYDRLPAHVSYLDALILPYLTEGRGHSITPLKLREYIATGKPVVATVIPECRLYQDVIRIATSHEEFLAALASAVVEGDEKSGERREAVSRDGWNNRAEMLSGLLDSILNLKTVAKVNSDQMASA